MTFNRTNLELKLPYKNLLIFLRLTFNRTNLELKRLGKNFDEVPDIDF